MPKYLSCAQHCARPWKYDSEQLTMTLPSRSSRIKHKKSGIKHITDLNPGHQFDFPGIDRVLAVSDPV